MLSLATRRPLVLLLVVAASAGCGDAAAPNRTEGGAEPTVDVRIDLGGGAAGAGQAGPPDAGTATGHGGDATVLRADGPAYTLRGRVEPADSTLRLDGPAGPATARKLDGGRFEGRVTGLRRGLNRVRVQASRPGHADWSREIRIRR